MRKLDPLNTGNKERTQSVNFEINLFLHPAQERIVASKARFKVIAAGRRFGKTMLSGALATIQALSEPDQVVWWVAPSHQQARIAFKIVRKFIPEEYRTVNNTLGEIYLVNGSTIAVKSGDRYDNLRGEGLDMVVVDEAAFLHEKAWTEALRPALADKNGSAILISTFDGENWFYDLQNFAMDPDNTEWEGWRFTTADNPFVPASEIEQLRRTMSHESFMQEIMCVPNVYVGAVFDGELLAKSVDRGATFEPGGLGIVEAGLDWGWNYTAFEVCHEGTDGTVSWFFERVYRNMELNARCREIAQFCREFDVRTVYADAAGASENVTLARIMEREGADTYVQPVPFNLFKQPGIDTRRFYLQQGRERMGFGVPQLIRDSKLYSFDESGKPRKTSDHTVDAATAFYASRSDVLGTDFGEGD